MLPACDSGVHAHRGALTCFVVSPLQLLKVRKAKKPEPAPAPVLLPDLTAIGLNFELPPTVVRREEAATANCDELKRQVCTPAHEDDIFGRAVYHPSAAPHVRAYTGSDFSKLFFYSQILQRGWRACCW